LQQGALPFFHSQTRIRHWVLNSEIQDQHTLKGNTRN
jgi:hypothetical protein